MAFEIRNADYSTLSFIADTQVSRSNNPVRKAVQANVSHEDKIDFYVRQYKETLDHARQTGSEAVICAVDRATGRVAAWAHWVLPQDTDDPAPHALPGNSFPPGSGGNEALLQEMRTKYRQSRKEALKGRRCFILHNVYTHADYSGAGAGSLLIRWAFDDADRLGVPIILGTRREGYTIPVYRKHGFEVVSAYEAEINGKAIQFVQMLREPNTAGRLTAGIIIVSDTASKDPSTDRSEAVLREVFEGEGGGRWHVGAAAIVPDGIEPLRQRIISWSGSRAGADAAPFNLILTTGGTGFALKDHTPEAVEPLLERKAPGLVHLMLSSSLQVTPFAAMARPVAGVIGKTLVVTLPGSPKGAKENLQAILKLLPHACQQAAGANSRTLHTGGVKKLESDAGLSATKAVETGAAAGVAAGAAASAGHDHHQHHHHHHNHHHQGPAGPHTKPEDRPVPNDPAAGPGARYRESPYPKLPVPDALRLVLDATPAPTFEERPVDTDLVGYILAEDITAPEPVPAFRASIVDGYACVTGADGHNQKGTFPVTLVSHATPGDIATLQPGQLARITTGAPLPPGATAVVMVEDTVLRAKTADGAEEAEVEILTNRVQKGENVREVGSDMAAGAVILRRGQRVTAVGGELGMLAAAGRGTVRVFRRPAVGVLSTGDELVAYDRPGPLRAGEVRDTNRLTRATAVRGGGFAAVDLGIARDTPAGELEAALRGGLTRPDVDVVVTTGGVSMGELDLLKPTLERQLGGTIHFGRVAMKPGMPTTFATVPHLKTGGRRDGGGGKGGLVFGLPGNPASGMVTATLFLRPCLELMAGAAVAMSAMSGSSSNTTTSGNTISSSNTTSSGEPETRPDMDMDMLVRKLGAPRIRVALAADTRADPARLEYQRAIAWQDGADHQLKARPTSSMQRSSRVGSFAAANCLLVVPAGGGTVAAGTLLEALLLGGAVSLGGPAGQ